MRHSLGGKKALILCNMVLILVMLWAAVSYSGTLTEQKKEMKRDNFCNNVDALKQVSQNYLITEKGYVNDWTAYIEAKHMTAEEALAACTVDGKLYRLPVAMNSYGIVVNKMLLKKKKAFPCWKIMRSF